MSITYNEKQKTTNDGKNRSTKSKKKNENTQRKGNFQILGNIGSGHHQINGDERKKIYLRRTRRTTRNQTK